MRMRTIVRILVWGTLASVLLAPLLWLLWIRLGPTAAPPTEDPLDTWNRAHADATPNGADLYVAAFDALPTGRF